MVKWCIHLYAGTEACDDGGRQTKNALQNYTLSWEKMEKIAHFTCNIVCVSVCMYDDRSKNQPSHTLSCRN